MILLIYKQTEVCTVDVPRCGPWENPGMNMGTTSPKAKAAMFC